MPEYAEIRFNPSGTALVLMGTKTHGQGHETAFKQILHEKLGIDPADVQYHRRRHRPRSPSAWGRTARARWSTGGAALVLAADKVIEKGRKIAAHLLEAAAADIGFRRRQIHRRRHRPRR